MELNFNSTSDPCPGSTTIDTEEVTIKVYLYDQFSTTVQGAFLQENQINIQVTTSSSFLESQSNNEIMDPITGAASFSFSFCGPNNSTIGLQFDVVLPDSHSTEISCSILFYGCKENFTPQFNESSSCDICVPVKSSKIWIVFVVLIGVIICLCIILLLLLSAFFGAKYW